MQGYLTQHRAQLCEEGVYAREQPSSIGAQQDKEGVHIWGWDISGDSGNGRLDTYWEINTYMCIYIHICIY